MLKRIFILTFALTLLAFSFSSHAEFDLSSMDTDALYHLRDAINIELSTRNQSDGEALATWDTSMGHITLNSIRTGTTETGEPGALCSFSYTNTSDATDTMNTHHWIKVFQDGVQLEQLRTFLNGEMLDLSGFSVEVQPGQTVDIVNWLVCLPGTSPSIDVCIEDRTSSPYTDAGTYTFALQ